MKKTIAIIVPDDCEVLVLKPGMLVCGRRVHQAIIVGDLIEAVSFQGRPDETLAEKVARWYDEAFLTCLAVGAEVTHLDRP